MSLIESTLHPEAASFRHVIPAGEPYLFEVKAGQTLRLLDLEGNQAVDTLFFSARNPRERYDPQRTLRKQNSVYLTTGTVLWSNLGNPLLTITADTCGRHDTLGGACAAGEQHRPLRPGKALHAQPAATTSCAACAARRPAEQARHRRQHQLLHERAGHPGRRPDLRGRRLGPGKYVELARKWM